MRLMVAALIALSVAGCTAQKWQYEDWVPYGASEEVGRPELEQLAAASCPIPDLLNPRFISDGCSLWPEGRWGGCCVAHDLAYWCGGSREARRQADQELRECVTETSGGFNALLMYMGVRLGGHPVWPFSFRWGYGRRWRGRHWKTPETPIPASHPENWNAMQASPASLLEVPEALSSYPDRPYLEMHGSQDSDSSADSR